MVNCLHYVENEMSPDEIGGVKYFDYVESEVFFSLHSTEGGYFTTTLAWCTSPPRESGALFTIERSEIHFTLLFF